jgi:hypothetical protein
MGLLITSVNRRCRRLGKLAARSTRAVRTRPGMPLRHYLTVTQFVTLRTRSGVLPVHGGVIVPVLVVLGENSPGYP